MPYIKTRDIQTYYEIQGEGLPLVLIQGFGLDLNFWKYQVEELSKKYKVITYDLRGNGRSSSNYKNYSIEVLADDLHILLNKLGILRSYVCGIALGGMIAKAYTNKYEEHVTGLILSDIDSSSSLILNNKLKKFKGIKFFIKLFSLSINQKNYSRLNSKFVNANKKIKEFYKSNNHKFSKEELPKITKAFFDFEDRGEFKIPTLIIAGERENKKYFEDLDNLKERFVNSHIEFIKDSGSLPNLDNAEEFNKQVKEFLNKCEHHPKTIQNRKLR